MNATVLDTVTPAVHKLKISLGDGGFELYFGQTDEREKAMWLHYGTTKMKASPFFALSDKQADVAVGKVRQAIRERRNIVKRLQQIGGTFITEIMKRTEDGKTPEGKDQRSYSDKYLEMRLDPSKRPKSMPQSGKRTGNPVRNSFTSDMLRSINKRDI